MQIIKLWVLRTSAQENQENKERDPRKASDQDLGKRSLQKKWEEQCERFEPKQELMGWRS